LKNFPSGPILTILFLSCFCCIAFKLYLPHGLFAILFARNCREPLLCRKEMQIKVQNHSVVSITCVEFNAMPQQ